MNTWKTSLITVLLALAGGAHWAYADEAKLPLVQGEVRKVDLSAQNITLKHGDIKNLDMPAMSMVFKVKDPALLDKVKAGDKVLFSADNLKGALTVVSLEPVAP